MMRTRWLMACPALAWAVTASGAGLEYPMHAEPRSIIVGGTAMATSSPSEALFVNPAMLAGLPEGWLRWVAVSASSTQRTESFFRRLRAALDIDDVNAQRAAVVDVLRHYRGQNVHASADLRAGASWRDGGLAASVAWIGSARIDGRSHQAFGDQGLLSVQASMPTGPVVGVAGTHGPWRFGFAIKHLRRVHFGRSYAVREIVEMTRSGYSFTGDRRRGSATGIDLGLQYTGWRDHAWRPQLGLVVHHAGGLDFGAAGSLPQTVTAGVAVQPPAATGRLTLTAEYFDIEHRLPEDGSHGKRIRAGVQWTAWERNRSGIRLRAGLHQRALAAGADLRLSGVRLGAFTYAAEQGAYAGQDRDRRYTVTAGLEF